MKKAIYFLGFLLVSSFFIMSCETDSDEENLDSGSGNCNASRIEQLSVDVSDTGVAYAGNQTTANCIAYNNALTAFINEAENCPEVQAQVNQLKELQALLSCN
ncbi:conserved exported hypothetical protein [Tenacibaculum sp. 190524A05c]|uniref:hypothetical protein n=1 Tax=Tenacibaculum platacis TaxID=3137852 RepID=UPI0031FB8AB2